MGRNLQTDGVVLHVYRVAEYHKGLVILSPDLGIFHATAFGAYKGKSKLSGVSEPFTEGRMFLYHDPVKDRYKVSEIAPVRTHHGLRYDLDRYYTALFWTELIMKSFAGGEEFEALFRFFSGSLQVLEATDDTEAVLIQFVWRYIGLTGFQPDIGTCAECGRNIERTEALYLQDGQFVCQECAGRQGPFEANNVRNGPPFLSPAARSYLLHSSSLPLEKTTGVKMGQADEDSLKRLLFIYIEDIIGRPLVMLQKGLV